MVLYCILFHGFVLNAVLLDYVVVCRVVFYCAALFYVVVNRSELCCMTVFCLALYSARYGLGLDVIVLSWIVLSCSAAYIAVWCCTVLDSIVLCCMLLCCIMLLCDVWYCIVLRCAVLL